jgi:transposase
MEYYAGIDVSLEASSVCVVDASGKIVREAKVASDPQALTLFFGELGNGLARIGIEACPLSQWLHAGLSAAGFAVVLLEVRHVKAAISAMAVKTDRNDARGIAQLLRMGWYRPVHCKSQPAQDVRALLTARKQLLVKAIDVELCLRGLLRGYGLKMGQTTSVRFSIRVRELAAGHPVLEQLSEAMLRARDVLRKEIAALHRQLLAIARSDNICRHLMTVPGVGALTALTFKTAVDDPTRFTSSKRLGAHFGLTPRKYQSGTVDITGSITKAGDAMVRSALYEAAHSMLTRVKSFSSLKRWAMAVAKRRGLGRATVALARKLAIIMHRMWVNGTDFRFGKEEAATA